MQQLKESAADKGLGSSGSSRGSRHIHGALPPFVPVAVGGTFDSHLQESHAALCAHAQHKVTQTGTTVLQIVHANMQVQFSCACCPGQRDCRSELVLHLIKRAVTRAMCSRDQNLLRAKGRFIARATPRITQWSGQPILLVAFQVAASVASAQGCGPYVAQRGLWHRHAAIRRSILDLAPPLLSWRVKQLASRLSRTAAHFDTALRHLSTLP